MKLPAAATEKSGVISRTIGVHRTWLALAPVVAFVVFQFAMKGLSSTDLPPPCTDPCTYKPASEAADRLMFIATILLFYLSATVTSVLLLISVRRNVDGATFRSLLGLYIAGLLLALVWLVLGSDDKFADSLTLLGRDTFTSAFAPLPAGIWNQGLMEGSVVVFAFLLAAAGLAIVLALLSCASRTASPTEADWQLQSQRFRTILYTAAGTVALAVITVRAIANYPTFIFAEAADSTAYSSLAKAYMAVHGIEFSLVLAVAALPIAYLLSQDARGLAVKVVGQAKTAAETATLVSAYQEKQSLRITVREALTILLAVATPLLTGTVPTLTSVIG